MRRKSTVAKKNKRELFWLHALSSALGLDVKVKEHP